MGKIYAVSRETIISKGGLVEDQILDAMKKYPNQMLEKTEEEYLELLAGLIERNGEGNAFVDCYYGRLKKEEQKRILEALSDEEVQMLERHDTEGGIYFPLTKENLPLMAAFSAREILFSTYYFTKHPCTIWGNYDLKYPVFYESELESLRYHGKIEKR